MASDSARATPELKQAWDSYHAALDEMRNVLEESPRFRNEAHRAKAYHVLMEIQAMAYNYTVAPRMSHPRVFFNLGWQTDIYTLGTPGPDFVYGVSMLDGSQTYKLSGRVGDVSLFMVNTHTGVMGTEDFKFTANYDMLDFEIAKDGAYEVILSADEHDGNWIKLDPDSEFQFLNFRRVLQDWQGDPGEMRIELVGNTNDFDYSAHEFDEAEMAARIRRAEGFVRYVLVDWVIGLYDLYLDKAGGKKNVMSPFPGDFVTLGSWASSYSLGVFEIEEDEALLIEFEEMIDGNYWSFELSDAWSRPLPFASRHTSLNRHQSQADPDGQYRFIVAHRDPGFANWLDTCGWTEGTVVVRNYQGKEEPKLTVRKVAFADLEKLMPANASRVTAEQREQIIVDRRRAWQKLLGE